MRLTRKFIAALVIGVALVALIQAYLDYQRERDVFDRQMRGEAAALGRALARGVAHVWQRDGEPAARAFLETATSKREESRRRSSTSIARRSIASSCDGASATSDPPREAMCPVGGIQSPWRFPFRTRLWSNRAWLAMS